jgi:MscS family membrane protein
MQSILAEILGAPGSRVLEPANPAGRELSEVEELPARVVGWLHGFFPDVNEDLFRWIACLVIIGLGIVLRRAVTAILYRAVRRLAGRARTGIDDEVFGAVRRPVAALLMLLAVFTALAVLNLPPGAERLVTYGTRVAFTGMLLWAILCAGIALLDHFEDVARQRGLGIATLMPLVRKTLGVVFSILGFLIIAESLGADVKTFLAGLGIGGLALALAAQDTIANMFGSFVVVVDRPFLVGDTVRIAGNEGTVEDIGLRSTRLRTAERTLIVIPNKVVASEAITNLSRIPQRRVSQTVRLAYRTEPGKMEAVLGDLREVLRSDPDVQPGSSAVNFSEFGDSSLDIQLAYFTASPDGQKCLDVRERINLKIMRAVEARGLALALPTRAVIRQEAPGRGDAGKPDA